MSISWARKYRPTTLNDVVGNERLKTEVEMLINRDKLPQTILLEGVQGTGKTTMARLIAKSLLCENYSDGPCNNCYHCQRLSDDYIVNGNTPSGISVFDYNISKLNRTEDTERIVENMQGQNFDGSKRVFILDEMQVASQQAQTRFLKVAEEPMENLYIIMCTTNPEKLLKPLKSRFINYKLKKPTSLELAGLLEKICISEGVNFSKTGLKLVVDKMNRNPRETINRAELISNTGDLIRTHVAKNLDVISEDLYVDFIKACKTSNLTNIAKICVDLEENNIEFRDFVLGMGEFLVNLIDITTLVKIDIYSDSEVKSYKRLVKDITDKQLVGLLKITKDQYGIYDSERFLIYSYATECMGLFYDVEDTTEEYVVDVPSEKVVPEIDEMAAMKKYSELTKSMDAAKSETVEVKSIDANGLADIFGANKVDI